MRSWLLAARGLVFGVAVSRTDKVLANIMKAGKVIKSREDVMAVIVGIVLFGYLTAAFSHCAECLNFPAHPKIINVIVTEIFGNQSLRTFYCRFFFKLFFILAFSLL